MKVTVFSGAIRDADVELALVCDGLAALETTRTEAEMIYRRIRESLNINSSAEDSPFMYHLSVETSNGGWTSYLVYFDSEDSQEPQVWNRAVKDAIDQWIAAGSQDKFVAKIAD